MQTILLINTHISQVRLFKGINKIPLLDERIKLIISKVFLNKKLSPLHSLR
jgi:hypothetical protein